MRAAAEFLLGLLEEPLALVLVVLTNGVAMVSMRRGAKTFGVPVGLITCRICTLAKGPGTVPSSS